MKIGNRSKSYLSSIVFSIFFLTIVIIPLIPTASAGGQDATFDSVSLKAVPPVQGVGGEVHIEAKVKFFGGCCYHLYAHDVKAELINLPKNISIVSTLPSTVGKVDAQSGGSPTFQKTYSVLPLCRWSEH